MRSTNEYEKNRVRQENATRFTALDSDLKRAKDSLGPAMDELSEKLRMLQKQIFALRWKAESHKKDGRRFASVRFGNYLRKLISP